MTDMKGVSVHDKRDDTVSNPGSLATVAGSTQRPLEGIKVVDASQVAAGPFGTSLLADFGADVIKVEPLEGDSMRHADEGFGPGESAYFFGVNRNKRSIGLDLKEDEGKEILRKLVSEADVFVIAFRPQASRRLGIDYESLRKIKPDLIYVSVTAFGEEGPRADQPGMDILAQAMSGFMGVTGERNGPPVKGGAPIADFISSFLLGFGVCAALRHRDRTGRGDRISISLLNGLIATFSNYVTAIDRMGLKVEKQGGAHPQLVPYQPFQDADGDYFILACLNDKFWQNLLPILDNYGEFRLPEFETNWSRVEHRELLIEKLIPIFKTKSANYWLDELEDAGVPCSPINDLEAALNDPQVVANRGVVQLSHPKHGKYKVLNNPIQFEHAETGATGHAPQLGEHTVQLLLEYGYSQDEVDELIAQGIVAANRDV